jgi:cytochrome c oxidase subunit II
LGRPFLVRAAYNQAMSRLTLAVLLAALFLPSVAAAQDLTPNRREFTIVARDYQFTPSRIEVAQDDLVTITLRSEERPHSFAIDAYRIVKRAGGGQTVTFEFRADQAGRFEYYCNMTADARCAEMRGLLVVHPR